MRFNPRRSQLMAEDKKSPSGAAQSAPSEKKPSPRQKHEEYWRANLIVLACLLFVWFLFGCVFSIFMVETLNEVKIGGFPLGFWIAQQGTIYVFIILILVYALVMRKLDKQYDVEEDED